MDTGPGLQSHAISKMYNWVLKIPKADSKFDLHSEMPDRILLNR